MGHEVARKSSEHLFVIKTVRHVKRRVPKISSCAGIPIPAQLDRVSKKSSVCLSAAGMFLGVHKVKTFETHQERPCATEIFSILGTSSHIFKTLVFDREQAFKTFVQNFLLSPCATDLNNIWEAWYKVSLF